jgi:hypothetical protein
MNWRPFIDFWTSKALFQPESSRSRFAAPPDAMSGNARLM